jgi:hypothetical protein
MQWSATPNVIDQWGANQPAHSGTWSAWLDGAAASNTDSISQLVSIPASTTATLSYYVHIDTNQTSTTSQVDSLTVRAGSNVLQTLSNLNAADGYQYKTVDLSAYAGQTIRLSFTGVQAGSVATSFVLDDLSVSFPSSTAAPSAPTGVSAAPGDALAVVSWAAPANNGGCQVTGYTVTASPGGRTATTTGSTTATVTGLTNGTAYTFTVIAANAAGVSPASTPSSAVTPRSSGFTGTAPVRVLDTRLGVGAVQAKVGAGQAVTLTVPGLPAGATAVALNVTVTNPTAAGYLSVYPAGVPRPTASNLNFVAGETIPNMVQVPLGPNNTVTFYNAVGSVDVIADVLGYYG